MMMMMEKKGGCNEGVFSLLFPGGAGKGGFGDGYG